MVKWNHFAPLFNLYILFKIESADCQSFNSYAIFIPGIFFFGKSLHTKIKQKYFARLIMIK